MYERVIVPLDGSPLSLQVLPFASAIAGASGARLDFVRVAGPDEPIDEMGVALRTAGAGVTALAAACCVQRAPSRDSR